jgi:hypothetical protein
MCTLPELTDTFQGGQIAVFTMRDSDDMRRTIARWDRFQRGARIERVSRESVEHDVAARGVQS